MNWGPYVKYQTLRAGHKFLNGIDKAGGALAHFFGVTTPKYSSELYFREKDDEDEKRRREKQHEESANWLPPNNNQVVVEQVTTTIQNERF